jgi:catalase
MMSDELYIHERYKFGNKEEELAEFMDHVRRVAAAQKALAAEHSDGKPQRVFHTKAHACLAGKLTLLENRPAMTRHGLFGTDGKSAYNVIARFSSGVGFDQHDLKPDVRGIALKIFDVIDRSAAGEQQQSRTVDLLMTNSTNPFGQDQEEFVQFMEASVDPGLLGARLIAFLIRHDAVAKLLLKATLKIVPSLATEQYWSGHPYLLGREQAMKFNVRPNGPEQTGVDEILRQQISERDQVMSDNLERQLKRWYEMQTVDNSKMNSKVDSNYLSLELRNRLRKEAIRFVVSVQLEKDPVSTPIEDGLVEWKESDSPSIPVAELVLDREVEPALWQNLRFTPGNYIADHRPLGNMGRGRIFTYEASQRGRNAATKEPTERAIFGM